MPVHLFHCQRGADSLFTVLDKESIWTLDGIGMFIKEAFTNIFVNKTDFVKKIVSFNLLVTKYEAYLKKLYYLIHGHEVKPRYKDDSTTLTNAIYAFPCLWGLKNNPKDEYQRLYQYLEKVKDWRNEESHISPTASDQEIDSAISIAITMYFFVTGSNITELKKAGVL